MVHVVRSTLFFGASWPIAEVAGSDRRGIRPVKEENRVAKKAPGAGSGHPNALKGFRGTRVCFCGCQRTLGWTLQMAPQVIDCCFLLLLRVVSPAPPRVPWPTVVAVVVLSASRSPARYSCSSWGGKSDPSLALLAQFCFRVEFVSFGVGFAVSPGVPITSVRRNRHLFFSLSFFFLQCLSFYRCFGPE